MTSFSRPCGTWVRSVEGPNVENVGLLSGIPPG